ncbi:Ig-like domain repeat protein [Cellulomonas sp. DKR-3]|uniref:Ig-like domain repeat protein n=1 Tax=Cellulomonas fulva TaxID=2835530 RepID=A0ABS5TYI1_9CELL|nr:immunoglobulin-like domain-containing protein [Cellulomonas fulva]MBT0994195.1 Ig-like domain repeat protein [Cellulomonas fulva]
MRARRLWGAVAAASVGLTTAVVATPASAATGDGLVGWWKLDETSGTVAADSSGNGKDGTVSGAATWNAGDGFTFSGGASGAGNAVRLPDGLLSGLDTVSVDFDVLIDPTLANNYFIFSLGNNNDTGYVFVTGKDWEPRFRAAITKASGGADEQNTIRQGALTTNLWKHVTYTIVGGTTAAPGYSVLYEDGVEVARNSNITIKPSDIANGGTFNYLGRSPWAGDNSFKGRLRDFRVYDRELDAAELTELANDVTTPAVTSAATALTLGDTSAVTANLTLPATATADTKVTWASSDPSVVSAAGVVTRPAGGSPDATATLTATVTRGAATATRQFEVTVVARPDSEGLLAEDLAAIEVPNLDDARGNLTLPAEGENGSSFTWASDDESVVTPDGVVHRPAHGQPAATVELTVTGTLDDATATRTLTATVPALPEAIDPEAYVFAYFEGESTADGESIYLGASEGDDPTKWDDLNDADPVLTSAYGEKGLRDPFVIRSPEGDKFYLLATDLKIYPGGSFGTAQQTGSTFIEVWESTDLVHWSDQRHVKVSSDYAGNTWAPEAFYDEDLGAYVVYWASNLYPTTTTAGRDYRTTYNRMMYATTRDFVTFSEPQPWIDVKRGTGLGMIDSTVVKDGDTFYRFTKDEASMTVRQERSTDLLATVSGALPTTSSPATGWQLVKEKIGVGQPNPWGGTFTNGEGPTVFRSNEDPNTWYLFIDQPSYHGGQGYMAFRTTDIASGVWTAVEGAQLPSSPRHGTVLPVSQAEYEALLAAYQPDLLVESVDPQQVLTAQGVAPVLPATVTAHYADGSSAQVAVTWDAVDAGDYAAPGTFEVQGTVAGGTTIRASVTVRVTDDSDPVVTLTPTPSADGSAGWWRSGTVTVTADAADAAGVASVDVALDGGDWTTSTGDQATTTVTGDGEHVVRARATDTTGRTSATPESLTVKIDATAPVSRATVDAASRTVTVRAADETSGVAGVQYRIGTGAWQEYTGAVTVGSAATTVGYRSVDVAGNTEVVNTAVVPVDGSVPRTTRTVAVATSPVTAGTRARVTVSVSATSGTPTGTVRVLDGSTKVGSGTLSGGRATITLSKLGVGTHRLTVVYAGTARYAASQGAVTVKVVKAATRTKAGAPSVLRGQAARVTVGVHTVAPATGPASGTVKVTVTKAGKTYATRTATLGSNGTVTVTLPRLAVGTYAVRAAYVGTAEAKASVTVVRLTVRPAGAMAFV